MLERRLASTLAAVVLFPAGMSAPRSAEPVQPQAASVAATCTAGAAGCADGARTPAVRH